MSKGTKYFQNHKIGCTFATMKSKTLRFSAAHKSVAPTAFATLVKPIGSLCNLKCNYCYYLDKKTQYDAPAKLMSDEVLDEYIAQYIEGNDVDVVTFCWHGGEPLMAGLDFYKSVIELQNHYANGKRIENTLQTNGILITDEFARFFAEHNFLLGLSIDGPKEIHDANRMTANDEPTFDCVMGGIAKLQNAKAEFNTLSAVSATSAGKGVEIYEFLKSIGSRFMQFLPVVEHTKIIDGYKRPVICSPEDEEGQIAPWSIGGKEWGYFLSEIFDQWVKKDVGNYYVQMFDATLANWCGVRSGICSMNETCGDGLVVEHNGDVYSCDHFVYPDFKLGNIMEDELRNMVKSSAQFRFGAAKSSNLSEKCGRCNWSNLCHGECPKHHFGDNENYLCNGLQYFFRHSAPAMEYMKQCLEKQMPPALVMTANL